MNRLSWLSLIIALAMGAVLTTSAIKHLTKPLPPLPKNDGVKEAKATKPTPDENRQVPTRPSSIPNTDMDDLWEKSLFNALRTERIADAAEAQADQQNDQVNAEFELIGIARIGSPDNAQPIAIIKQKTAGAPRGRAIPIRPTRGRVSAPPPQAPPNPESKNEKVQKIFRIGEKLLNSGYVLQAITPQENSVLLVRGSEEVTLKIQLSDKEDSVRRDNVVNEALAVRQQQQATQEAEAKRQEAAAQTAAAQVAAQAAAAQSAAGAPPQPPPLPPGAIMPAPGLMPAIPSRTARGIRTPSGTSEASTSTVNSEERQKQIERARLLREKMLERQQQNKQ